MKRKGGRKRKQNRFEVCIIVVSSLLIEVPINEHIACWPFCKVNCHEKGTHKVYATCLGPLTPCTASHSSQPRKCREGWIAGETEFCEPQS